MVRRPDLTRYFVDGFIGNRDALAFSEADQELFAEVFPHITRCMREHFASGDYVVQSDRQICDAPGRSFHARQLLFGTQYLQVPYMWRQLTVDLREASWHDEPEIIELSIPNWLDDLTLPDVLRRRVWDAGLTQLVFKAPTKGLSLHLGFDYLGEHKMGPLAIAMFMVKQTGGLAVQAALSVARIRSLDGAMSNVALVTAGPSLHGKSTLTIMIELADSQLAKLLNLPIDPEEGAYPMNDDIVLLRPLDEPIEATRGTRPVTITHGIDGTESSFYAVPSDLTRDQDPITFDVIRGTQEAPNRQETLENVPINPGDGTPNFLENPVRNMRMVLSRPRLIERKGAGDLLKAITEGRLSDAVHVPMESMDRLLWQAVMRQNTVVPPLRRLTKEQYIRVLMYGEAVQMGAAAGTIGKPYIEYFSDPFIIGLEDENATLMYGVLQNMADGGLPQEYFVFNTGGIGAETNEEASGPRYRKIPRELTLMLQEALLRNAIKFEHDAELRSDVAVAIVDRQGEEVFSLRKEWLPREAYGEREYAARVEELLRRRYYGRDAGDRAGILRYTKVENALLDLEDIPPPRDERELAWLLSFFWQVDQAYSLLSDLARHIGEGRQPNAVFLKELRRKYESGLGLGLAIAPRNRRTLRVLGLGEERGSRAPDGLEAS